MERYFNVSGVCYPDIHYMVDLTERLVHIRGMIEKGFYFMINRARQYGKTTLLEALRKFLEQEYLIFSVSFAELGESSFQTEEKFCRSFVRLLSYTAQEDLAGTAGAAWFRECNTADQITDLLSLSRMITALCEGTGVPVVLMIDEVDSASNNQVFLDFLAMLRSKYLKRNRSDTFQSVILAGVYDIKNLKLRMRPDAEHKYNSPWNIAEDFTVDMNFSRSDIAGMLREYEKDRRTGMDVDAAAGKIHEFTGGYPYLVSRMCKLADETVPAVTEYADRRSAWSEDGLLRAMKILTEERNMLLDDMIKKISDHEDLDAVLRKILLDGMEYPYSALDNAIQLGTVFGILKKKDGIAAIANQVFETALYNYYILEQMRKQPDLTYGGELQAHFETSHYRILTRRT